MRQSSDPVPSVAPVESGADRSGEIHWRGTGIFHFKVSAQDSGGLFIAENTLQERGGAARHIHYNQDEWLYALDGEFIAEVAQSRFSLKPGDSLFLPRNVPHAWAYLGNTRGNAGKILLVYAPAGKIEGFFREVTGARARPPDQPDLWRDYDMEMVGPPLSVA